MSLQVVPAETGYFECVIFQTLQVFSKFDQNYLSKPISFFQIHPIFKQILIHF